MSPESIISVLEPLRHSEVVYLPNCGNLGDSLVAEGTYQVFERLGIRYRTLVPGVDATGKTLLVAGGGNLVGLYSYLHKAIDKLHASVDRLIVLPHTIADNRDLLGVLGENVTLICREATSYDHVRGQVRQAEVLLMDDMAFGIDVDDLLRDSNWKSALRTLPPNGFHRRWWAATRAVARFRAQSVRGRTDMSSGGVLNVFRQDAERTAIDAPPDNLDLPGLWLSWMGNRAQVRVMARFLFRFLQSFDEINTNRLHVCIAGALLGKRVHFYPNNYHKNESVYRYSIEQRFSKVRWKGGTDATPSSVGGS